MARQGGPPWALMGPGPLWPPLALGPSGPPGPFWALLGSSGLLWAPWALMAPPSFFAQAILAIWLQNTGAF